jgi:hypothetical protein
MQYDTASGTLQSEHHKDRSLSANCCVLDYILGLSCILKGMHLPDCRRLCDCELAVAVGACDAAVTAGSSLQMHSRQVA